MAVEFTLISSLRQSIEKSPISKSGHNHLYWIDFQFGRNNRKKLAETTGYLFKTWFWTKGLEETRLCLLFYLRCQGNFLVKNPIVKMWLNTSRTQHIPEAVSTSNAVCAVARGLETWARRTTNWASFCCLVTKWSLSSSMLSNDCSSKDTWPMSDTLPGAEEVGAWFLDSSMASRCVLKKKILT